MSTLALALRDTGTMLRPDARRSLCNVSITLSGLLVPIIIAMLRRQGVSFDKISARLSDWVYGMLHSHDTAYIRMGPRRRAVRSQRYESGALSHASHSLSSDFTVHPARLEPCGNVLRQDAYLLRETMLPVVLSTTLCRHAPFETCQWRADDTPKQRMPAEERVARTLHETPATLTPHEGFLRVSA